MKTEHYEYILEKYHIAPYQSLLGVHGIVERAEVNNLCVAKQMYSVGEHFCIGERNRHPILEYLTSTQAEYILQHIKDTEVLFI